MRSFTAVYIGVLSLQRGNTKEEGQRWMLPAEPVLLALRSRSEALCICLLDLWLVYKHFPSSDPLLVKKNVDSVKFFSWNKLLTKQCQRDFEQNAHLRWNVVFCINLWVEVMISFRLVWNLWYFLKQWIWEKNQVIFPIPDPTYYSLSRTHSESARNFVSTSESSWYFLIDSVKQCISDFEL